MGKVDNLMKLFEKYVNQSPEERVCHSLSFFANRGFSIINYGGLSYDLIQSFKNINDLEKFLTKGFQPIC